MNCEPDPRKGPCLHCHEHCRLVEQFEEAIKAAHSLHGRIVDVENRLGAVATRALTVSHAIEELERRLDTLQGPTQAAPRHGRAEGGEGQELR